MNERTVTDLETTALEASEEAALLLIDYGEQTADDRHGVICAAVRELARRAAETQYPRETLFTELEAVRQWGEAQRDRAVAAEADRDRLQAERDDLRFWNERVRTCEAHTDEIAAVGGDCLVCERDRYREALEQAVIATNGECPLCAPLNKWGHTPSCPLASALATPDTPPNA